MSTLDVAINLLRQFDEPQLLKVVGMLYVEKQRMEEAADDAFCLELCRRYDELPDSEKGDAVPIEQAIAEAGLTMDEVRNSN